MAFERNLVLVNDPTYQSLQDFEAIRDEIARIDPSISVHIAFNSMDGSRIKRRTAGLPTLVVSFTRLKRFVPGRGRVFQGRQISKLEQMLVLAGQGVPVPRTEQVHPTMRLDDSWGEVVVLKPNGPTSSRGKGVRLIRRDRFHQLGKETLSRADRHGLLVQEFVRTGPHPGSYRVLTLFGEPLFCRLLRRTDAAIDLAASDEILEGTPITSTGATTQTRELITDPEVLNLARQVHETVPDVPLKGVDIIREISTGRLFVLEFNPGGNTWHFSSHEGRKSRRGWGLAFGATEETADTRGAETMIAQFDALRTAARVLAQRTSREAA